MTKNHISDQENPHEDQFTLKKQKDSAMSVHSNHENKNLAPNPEAVP